MNAGQILTLESLFGPPSNPISISQFIETSSSLEQNSNPNEFCPTPQEIVDECSTDDLRGSLNDVWDNVILASHLVKDHDQKLANITSCLKRSRKGVGSTIPESVSEEAEKLQGHLHGIELKSFRLDKETSSFTRPSKNSDYNIFCTSGPIPTSRSTRGPRDAIITLSIHDKVSWGPSYATRSSQLIFLSSQTLDDLYNVIPCVSKNIAYADQSLESGYVLNLGGTLHENEGQGSYAEYLIQHLKSSPKKNPLPLEGVYQKSKNSRFDTLTVRLNEPYWLIHSGNCQHFVVFDQIRLAHHTDPMAGYPFIVQMPPTLLDLCRSCTKVPAIWSIVGDIRLGESPCVLCGPCWEGMGNTDDKDVVVVSIAMPPPPAT